jgi:hypothetical protein
VTTSVAPLLLSCPLCSRHDLTPYALRHHLCPNLHLGRLSRQEWHVAVDAALTAAGQPEMIYGYEVEYLRHDGKKLEFRIATSSARTAKRAAIMKVLYKEVTMLTPYSYAVWCYAFGTPGVRI